MQKDAWQWQILYAGYVETWSNMGVVKLSVSFCNLFWVNLIFQMKELAAGAQNPRLFTVATLTGHAVLAVGEGYSVGRIFQELYL